MSSGSIHEFCLLRLKLLPYQQTNLLAQLETPLIYLNTDKWLQRVQKDCSYYNFKGIKMLLCNAAPATDSFLSSH